MPRLPSLPYLTNALKSLKLGSSSTLKPISTNSFQTTSRFLQTRHNPFILSKPSLLTNTLLYPIQTRSVTYGIEYQPSQRKRKRKHGFLARSKGGRLGRKILKNRRAKGRRFLSH